MALNVFQTAAIVQAMHGVTAKLASAKDPESIRAQADEAMLDGYETDGIKSRDIVLNGEKLGTMTVRMSKAKTREAVQVTDPVAYRDWVLDNGYYTIDERAVLEHFHATGEVPEGARINVKNIPAQPCGTLLKTDPPAVARACRDDLPAMVNGLLTEGGE